MQRSQFVAAVVVLAVVVGLLAGRFLSDSPDDRAEAAAGSADTASDPDPKVISGGEQAAVGTLDVPAAPKEVGQAPPLLGEKPELVNLDGWLQTDATGLASFDGQVRIVQFWTFGCSNCKATLPHLQQIYADWHDRGLEIVGVHAPEFDHEADIDNIVGAAADLGVTWPIALDTEKTNFRAWQEKRRFWPRTYVLDQNGQVRFDHIGEGKYDELAETVAYLIENGP